MSRPHNAIGGRCHHGSTSPPLGSQQLSTIGILIASLPLLLFGKCVMNYSFISLSLRVKESPNKYTS